MQQAAAAEDFSSSSGFLSFARESEQADQVFYQATKEIQHELRDILDPEASPSAFSDPAPAPATPLRKKKESQADLAFYYKHLAKFPPYSREEEVAAFIDYNSMKKRLKKNSGKGARAVEREILAKRNRIVERNLKFVVKLAKTFWMDGNFDTFENLVSAGNIGLIRAIDRFDVTKGVRFLTYAANWIALEIRIELANSTLIHVPIWWQKTVKKLGRAYTELSKEKEHVCVAVLARRANVPVRHVKKLAEGRKVITRDQIPHLRTDVPFCEATHLLPDTPTPESVCIEANAHACLSQALYKLRDNEKRVIESVFGLGGQAPQNLRQVSNIMGNTGERVRQLKEKGIDSLRKKLSSPKELGGLGVDAYRDIL